jgi:hypothetical protein
MLKLLFALLLFHKFSSISSDTDNFAFGDINDIIVAAYGDFNSDELTGKHNNANYRHPVNIE